MSHPGLEVTPSSDPQYAGPPDIHREDKYYHGYSSGAGANTTTTGQHNRLNRRIFGSVTTLWLLVLITVICLSAALGVGLGVGLSAQRKSTVVPCVTHSCQPSFLKLLKTYSYHAVQRAPQHSQAPRLQHPMAPRLQHPMAPQVRCQRNHQQRPQALLSALPQMERLTQRRTNQQQHSLLGPSSPTRLSNLKLSATPTICPAQISQTYRP